MRYSLLACGVLLVAATAAAQPTKSDRLWAAMEAGWLAGNVGDYVTHYRISRHYPEIGVTEQNPVARGVLRVGGEPLLATTKFATAIGTLALLRWMRGLGGPPRALAWVELAGGIAVMAFITQSNMRFHGSIHRSQGLH
jgi:hypothetical protein